MRKILMLGGSFQQISSIKAAKKAGYYTILCDYLPDNPGQNFADAFYLVSTTDKEAILEIASNEKVSGIVAYASDPAALTAAYVAEKLHLPTNPYKSVEILSEKHLFRQFLKSHGFNVPKSKSFIEIDSDLLSSLRDFTFPVMVKPVDSSGSKGVSRIETIEELKSAYEYAKLFSRNGIVIIEEYVKKSHDYMIGGDIFVIDGKVQFWGLLNSHRDAINEFVPTGCSYPLKLTESRVHRIQVEIQKMLDLLQIQFGAFNIEILFDQQDRLYFIELGPRNGGNMIPQLLNMISGIDLVEATVESAMGTLNHNVYFNHNEQFYATHMLHSNRNGKLKNILFAPEIEQYIIKKVFYKEAGDQVEYFDSANKALGIIFMKFPSKSIMLKILEIINRFITLELV